MAPTCGTFGLFCIGKALRSRRGLVMGLRSLKASAWTRGASMVSVLYIQDTLRYPQLTLRSNNDKGLVEYPIISNDVQ